MPFYGDVAPPPLALYPNFMVLTSAETRTEFEFRVVGYQFPDIENEDYDANWLLVNIGVRSPAGSLTKTDPCLLTWEGHWFANWLADLVSGQDADDTLSFLDSNIFFTVVARDEHKVRLVVELGDELRPPDAKPQDGLFAISLDISLENLRLAAADWCWEMRLFPMRVEKNRPCRPYADKRTSCAVCRPETIALRAAAAKA